MQEVDQRTKEAVASDSGADEIIRTNEALPAAAKESLDNGISPKFLDTALSTASTTYAIAVPICIIYDGSIEKAGPSIDHQSAQAQRSYYAVASAADEQKAVSVDGAAIGSFQRKIKNAELSIPLQRANGKSVKTAALNPQSSATGDFTIFDALFGDNAATGILKGIGSAVCPVLTDWRTGLVAGVGEAVAGFFAKAPEEITAKAVQAYLRDMVVNIFSKKTARRIVGETVTVTGATLAAKLLVIQKLGAQTNGLTSGVDFVEQADAGGDINAQEINRQQFYGRPLTQAELAISNSLDREYLAKKQSEKSLYARYFDNNNPYSLRQKVGTDIATFAGGRSVNKLFTKLLATINPVSLLGKTADLFSSRHVSAQDISEDPYKVIQWGWSQSEESLIENNASYGVLANSEILAQSGQANDIEAEYGKCFTETMGTLIGDGLIKRDKDGNVLSDDSTCSPASLGVANKDFGDLVFRYRLQHRYDNTLDHLTDIQEAK